MTTPSFAMENAELYPCADCGQPSVDGTRCLSDRAAWLIGRAGATPRLRATGLDTIPDVPHLAEARTAAERWIRAHLDGDRQNLVIFGGVGSGKTHLAWGIVRRLCEHGEPARLENWRDLLAAAKRQFGKRDEPGGPSPIEAATRRRLLVLDDLGAERPTDWARDELATLIEYRYGERLPIVVTTNYAPDRLAERLAAGDPVMGERIVSRLLEDARAIEFPAVDLRVDRAA